MAGALTLIGMMAVASVSQAQDWPTPRGDTSQAGRQDTTQQQGAQAQWQSDTAGTRVRFVNAVSAGGNLALQSNQQPLFSGIEFKKASPYQTIEKTQLKDLTLQGGAGGETIDVDDLDENKHYTLVAVPAKDGKVKVEVLEDKAPDAKAANQDKAHVRVVYALHDDDADLVVTGQTESLFKELEVGVEDYKEIDPVSGSLTLQPEGEGAQPVELGQVELKAGHAYTLVLAGEQSGSADLLVLDETGIVGPAGEMDKMQHDNAIDRAADTSAISRDTSITGGGIGQDTTMGGFGRDTTMGGFGRDTTMGGFGRDTTIGGAGQDTTMGGMGRDSVQTPSARDPWSGRDTSTTNVPSPSRDTVPQSATPDSRPY
jgi:hypothetical protein